jgi:hypothetical protein
MKLLLALWEARIVAQVDQPTSSVLISDFERFINFVNLSLLGGKFLVIIAVIGKSKQLQPGYDNKAWKTVRNIKKKDVGVAVLTQWEYRTNTCVQYWR